MIPDLSVLVVTHNGQAKAMATLRSAISAAGSIDVEWIVVDNGSTDGTADAIECAFPDVSLIRSHNRGFAAGNNIGLGQARGRYMLLLNPDVEIVAGDLAGLIAAMDARPEVGLAGVMHRAPNGQLQHSIRRFPSVLRDTGEALFAARWPIFSTLQELETREGEYGREHSVDWMSGAFLIARREAVEAVGHLDERFFLYSEETDWCYRFWRSGWDVRYLPVMTIMHHCGRHDRGDLMPQLAYSRRLFAEKHFTASSSRQIRAALAFGHIVRLVLLGPLAMLQPRWRPRWRAERRALAVQLGLSVAPNLRQVHDRPRPTLAGDGEAHPTTAPIQSGDSLDR